MRLLENRYPLLILFMSVWFSSAERRRVPFKNCLSTKTDNDFTTIKPARSRIECSVICLNEPDCLSASYCKTSDGYACHLSGMYSDGNCSGLVEDGNCTVTVLVNPCENGGTFNPGNRTCQCVDGFVGDYCHRRYRDCSEAPERTTPGRITQYLIQPWGSTQVFEWFCNTVSSNLTAVIQFVDFFNYNLTLTWQQMRNGVPLDTLFFFLGLEQLYRLTSQGVYDLLVTLNAAGEDIGLVLYTNFRVDSEAEGYVWHWDSFHNDPSSGYIGSDQYLDGFGGAGDLTKNLNGARFGTFDRDVNDCARLNNASWWYNPVGCAAIGLDDLSWPTNRRGTVKLEHVDAVLLWFVSTIPVLVDFTKVVNDLHHFELPSHIKLTRRDITGILLKAALPLTDS